MDFENDKEKYSKHFVLFCISKEKKTSLRKLIYLSNLIEKVIQLYCCTQIGVSEASLRKFEYFKDH